MRRLVCSLAASFLAAASWAAEEPVVYPLSEVEPGLTGYGLSVFSGAEPERFEVEVIGVWHNVQPGMSYILARLSGQGLENSGVVAGMSGSPVFFDGRPAGAVAFSWAFAKEPIAGITPIETMRRLLEMETPAAPPLAAGRPAGLEAIARADLGADWLGEQLRVLAPSVVGETTAGLGWVANGFGERTRRLLGSSLGELAAAGSGSVDGRPAELVPGAAVAAVLVEGDLTLAATGTVTDRDGDALLAFGHPMFGLGALDVPMASAEVVTVVANQLNSFKVANVGSVEGAFVLDHAAGIRGLVGREASMIPFSVAVAGVDGDRAQRYDLRVADLPAITPSLVALTMLGTLDATTGAVGREGLDLVARFDLGPHGRLEIDQSFDGAGAEISAAIHLLAVTGYLLQNPLAAVEVAGLELELTRHLEPRTRQLIGAHAARSVVAPGEELDLHLDFLEYRGGRSRLTYPVEVPRSLPEGRYSLLVGDGVSLDVARLAIERLAPVTFPQALEYLDSLHSRRDLVVLGVIPGQGLAVAGETLPRLPGSVRSLWAAGAAGGAQPLELALVDRRSRRLDQPIAGAFRVDLEIERKAREEKQP